MNLETYLKENELQIIKALAMLKLTKCYNFGKYREALINFEEKFEIKIHAQTFYHFFQIHLQEDLSMASGLKWEDRNKVNFHRISTRTFFLLFSMEREMDIEKAKSHVPKQIYPMIEFFNGKDLLLDYIHEVLCGMQMEGYDFTVKDFDKLLNTPLEEIKILEIKVIKTLNLFKTNFEANES